LNFNIAVYGNRKLQMPISPLFEELAYAKLRIGGAKIIVGIFII